MATTTTYSPLFHPLTSIKVATTTTTTSDNTEHASDVGTMASSTVAATTTSSAGLAPLPSVSLSTTTATTPVDNVFPIQSGGGGGGGEVTMVGGPIGGTGVGFIQSTGLPSSQASQGPFTVDDSIPSTIIQMPAAATVAGETTMPSGAAAVAAVATASASSASAGTSY